MRSISRSRSRRQEGSWTEKVVSGGFGVGVSVRVQPRAVRYWWIRAGLRAELVGVSSTVAPRWRWTCWTERLDGGARCGAGGDLGDDDVDECAFGVASVLEDDVGDEGVGDGGGVEVGAALEAVGGVGVEAVAPRGAADADRIEPCGFDEDVFGFGGDHGVPAAHDSGEAEGFFVVRDNEVVGFEGALGAVEELEFFAFVREADEDAAFELVEVEGVGGMAHAEEDEVAGVDCV